MYKKKDLMSILDILTAPHPTEMTVLQGYKTIIFDGGLYLFSFP